MNISPASLCYYFTKSPDRCCIPSFSQPVHQHITVRISRRTGHGKHIAANQGRNIFRRFSPPLLSRAVHIAGKTGRCGVNIGHAGKYVGAVFMPFRNLGEDQSFPTGLRYQI